jgi:hypothetical protein
MTGELGPGEEWCTVDDDIARDPYNDELIGWEDVFGPYGPDDDAPPLGLLLYGRRSV